MHALAKTCDLWVLPSPRKSAWFSRIDWYLNWQMCRALAYPGIHLPSETLRLAEDFEVEVLATTKPEPFPLMVITGGLVPASKCVVIDSREAKTWLEDAFETALKIKASNVHVFLPNGVSQSEAQKLWPKKSTMEVEFSEDTEALS